MPYFSLFKMEKNVVSGVVMIDQARRHNSIDREIGRNIS